MGAPFTDAFTIRPRRYSFLWGGMLQDSEAFPGSKDGIMLSNTIYSELAITDNAGMGMCSICGEQRGSRMFRGKPVCAACIKFIKEH
jgi:hypothetical protein